MKLRTIAQKCGLHQGRKWSGDAWFSAHFYILSEQRTNIKHNGETFLESFKRHRLLRRADLRCDWHRVPTMLLCHAASRLPVHQKAPRLRLVYVHCLEIQVENHCCLESPFLTAQQLHSHEAATRVAAVHAHFQALAAGIIKEWIIKVLTIKHCWTGYLARILPD